MAIGDTRPLFTMDATRGILNQSKMPTDTEMTPEEREAEIRESLETGEQGGFTTRYLEDPNGDASLTDMTGPVTTAKDIRSTLKATEFENPIAQKVFTTALGYTPLAPLYNAPRAFLGAVASGMESFEDGLLGDMFGTRTAEEARDNLEDSGYSYGQSSSAVSGDHNAPGTGGTPEESATREMARASGDSGAGIGFDSRDYGSETDPQGSPGSYGNVGSLGDAASGNGGDSGSSEGGGTGRGSSDNDSEPGGIGGV